MKTITDTQRINVIQGLLSNGDVFNLRKNPYDDPCYPERTNEPKLQLFTVKTQHIYGDTVRELVDKVIRW